MSPSARLQGLAVLSIVAAACTLGPTEGPSPQFPLNIPTVPAPAEPVGRLVVSFDTRESFVGLLLRLNVAAYNLQGSRMSTLGVMITSSNPSVATVENVQQMPVQQPNGPSTSETLSFVSLRVEGTAVLRVRLGDVTDSTILNVRALPPSLNVLAVDSFTVVEYFACPTCNRPVYAPLLKLRELTGTSWANVIAVEFNVPTMTTGLCTASGGGLHFASGLSAHVNYIDPDFYNNEMIFASVNGGPLPDGPARARVVVKDATGNYGVIEAMAPIQRMVSNPTFPPASFANVYWTCNGRWP